MQPISSIYPDIIEAFLLQVFFVVLLALAYVCTEFSIRTGLNLRVATTDDNYYKKKIIVFGYVLSTIGFLFLLYDKIYIQGIDYSHGFAIAREQWGLVAENRDGSASSVYSVVGYLIGSGYFFSLALLFSKSTDISDMGRMFGIFCGITLLLLNSIITGGRSSILLAVAFVTYSACLNAKTRNLKLFRTNAAKSLVIISACGLVFYVVYIFSLRSVSNQMDFSSYGLGFLQYLGLEPHQWFFSFVQESQFGGVFALINLAVSYLTHSLSTTAAIIDSHDHGTIIVFNYLYSLLAKVGLIQGSDLSWFLQGRFSSLPGAIYFQLGLAGVAICSLTLGSLSGIFNLLYIYKNSSVVLLLACCAMEAILLLSPFVFAGDFLSFPFVITGAVFSMLLAKIPKVRLKGFK
ncbi:Oligosaccharide repeat unit polymerase OS=Eoetvoesiella caeni OX=645616 GN=DFR37_10290 PE=4 SV=1 [Eoetvoesiella caeni]